MPRIRRLTATLTLAILAGGAAGAQDRAADSPPPPPPSQTLRDRQLPARLTGTARLVLRPAQRAATDTVHTWQILVDLREVAIDVEGHPRQPAVLGAYTLGVRFDPHRARLVQVTGGKTREFARPPAFTALDKANAEGLVRLSAVHTQSRSPAGLVSVARVQLELSDPQAAESVCLLGDSLSTSILFFPDQKVAGPFLVPFEGEALPPRPPIRPPPLRPGG